MRLLVLRPRYLETREMRDPLITSPPHSYKATI